MRVQTSPVKVIGNSPFWAASDFLNVRGQFDRERPLFACAVRRRRFPFLGFNFICGKSRQGSFQLHRKTRRDRMRAKLKDIKAELRRRMHQPIPSQGRWLKQVVTGHFAYYAVPTNSRALSAFRHYVTDLWRRARRSPVCRVRVACGRPPQSGRTQSGGSCPGEATA